MSSPKLQKDVVTSTTIKGPKPLKVKAPRSFETSATINEGTRRHTQLRRRLLSAEHVLAVSITSSRFCLPGVGKTFGKAFEKPRNSQWLHFVTAVGVTVELWPKLNVTCIVFEDEVRTAQ
jgi:hypothetical protein